MGRMIGFAVVGSGMIGRLHARVLGTLEDARLVATADVDPARATWLADAAGARAMSVEAALASPDVDAVIVCTPSGLHAEIGERAARAGKHVLLEKPIDVRLDAADQLIAACRRAGVRLGVVSQHRFDASMARLKRAVDAGLLGTPYFGTAVVRWWREQSYYDAAGWRGTRALDGGALLNQGVHHVDLLLWLLGPATRVSARCVTVAHRMECEDLALATVDFASGAVATIEVTTAAYPGFPERLTITGERGTVVVDGADIATWDLRDNGSTAPGVDASHPQAAAAGNGHTASADPAALADESHRRQVADFVAAIHEGREPAVTGIEARRALELVLAAGESQRLGAPVELLGQAAPA